MKFFVFILVVILSIGVHLIESSNERKWKWEDIKPDDLVVNVTSPQPAAHPKREARGRIFNGRETNDNDHCNFQVRIIARKEQDKLFGCGASLISNTAILTAAHCVDGAKDMEIYFGVRDTKDIDSGKFKPQKVDASAFRTPKKWNPVTLLDDIAIVKLNTPIEYSETVGPIALPLKTDTCPGYTGKTMSIFGWGRINDAGDRSEILKTSVVDIAAGKDCKSVYSWLFNDKMICADGSKYTGTCKGDSGGPLVQYNGDKPTIVGVVSYGTNNCATTEPRVFTCIAAHLDWIENNK